MIIASPTSPLYSVYSDSTNIYPSNTLAYGGATGISGGSPYIQITCGNHTIKLTSNGGTSYPVDTTINFSANGYYSVFAYDTATGSAGLKTLVLNDNLTPPRTGQAELRFINLSPNSQSLNVSLINTDSKTMDTILLSNIGYIGYSEVVMDSLSAFKTISAGTYNVSLNTTTTPSMVMFKNSVPFNSGKIYTIYAKGYVNGINANDSLSIGIIENY